MITLHKDGGTKFVSEDSALLQVLLKQGWVKEEKKEVKNGKTSKSGS